jgi:hypothetical protein
LIEALIKLELYDVLGILRKKLSNFCDKYIIDDNLIGVQQPEPGI